MSEYSQNQNNPSGIWQHIWVTLTMQALDAFNQKKYITAYNVLLTYKTQLPPECEKECQTKYEEIQKIIGAQTEGYSQENAEEKRTAYLHKELPKKILELLATIRNSLFEHGWINKSFGAKPKFSGGGTL
jgi:hypothetical protein